MLNGIDIKRQLIIQERVPCLEMDDDDDDDDEVYEVLLRGIQEDKPNELF